MSACSCVFFFFFNDTATTEIYTLSLHDALPICHHSSDHPRQIHKRFDQPARKDRKSTRLNSSHDQISYAVFCLKKKKKNNTTRHGMKTLEDPLVTTQPDRKR